MLYETCIIDDKAIKCYHLNLYDNLSHFPGGGRRRDLIVDQTRVKGGVHQRSFIPSDKEEEEDSHHCCFTFTRCQLLSSPCLVEERKLSNNSPASSPHNHFNIQPFVLLILRKE